MQRLGLDGYDAMCTVQCYTGLSTGNCVVLCPHAEGHGVSGVLVLVNKDEMAGS